jgi:DNA invertase Pin-like site-specific DNA recombinase
MKKVIELIRVSTEGQAGSDRASIPAQQSVNRRTAQQYGLDIVRSIQLADVSGTAILKTSEIQEMLKWMESPDISGVVTREFSRLMRPENYADYIIMQWFADSNTVLYLPDGPIDFNSKTGRFMGTIRAAMAGMERTEILERIWTAKEEKRRRGELAQSQVCLPFGVGYEAKRGFFYKPESEHVREAFRRFLAGEQSYLRLSKIVGVTPAGMHSVMRNPIWTGWRVIDKKRDPSANGRYPGTNGRQADRHKVKRAEEDIIRVQVISEPLISPADFQRVQQIMDLKQKKHWRSRPNYEHRFIYSGFLSCAVCGAPIHSTFQRRDYYVCRARRTDHVCKTRYMSRPRLETDLNVLFARQLTDKKFLRGCVAALRGRDPGGDAVRAKRNLATEIATLEQRRGRIIDTYLEGVVTREDRDRRLNVLDRDLQDRRVAMLAAEADAPAVQLTTAMLVELLAPLADWAMWNREQQRRVLAALVPDIRVSDYRIESLGLRLPSTGVGVETRAPADTSTTVPASAIALRP